MVIYLYGGGKGGGKGLVFEKSSVGTKIVGVVELKK